MSILTGSEFKAKYPNTKFYKLTNKSENHNGFQFIDGINIDTQKFNPSCTCSKGGLYFTELNKIAKWISYGEQNMKYIREVKILDDSQICIEENKFKTNKFILHPKVLLEEFEQWNNFEFCKLAVQQNGYALKYVKNQTDEICNLAVIQNPYTVYYVKDQTEEICKLAVQQNGIALRHVKEKTEEICKLAVQQNGEALKYVKNQTEDICKIAVQQNGEALKYVKNQTEYICKIAVQQNGSALYYVKDQTEEICKMAVQKNSEELKYVKKQT
jgi:hypothetical protein